MKITKTQINYLDNRLEDIMRQKIADFKKKFPEQTTAQKWEDIYKGIKSGKIPMYPLKEFITNVKGWCSPDVKDMFDLSRYEKAAKEQEDSINEYSDKLRKAKTEIMDKVVLSDLMIEEAVAEFKKL